MAVLRPMMQFGTDGFVFPGLNDASTLSPMTLARLVVATGGAGATVHGMRSTFRDWAGEATNYPREVAEAALAHALEDKTEAAYQRGDLLERRRRLMADWAAFCDRPMVASEVIPLRAAAAE
jgi:integrase